MPIRAHTALMARLPGDPIRRCALQDGDEERTSLKLKNKKKMVNINQLGQFLIHWSSVVSS